MLRKIDFDPKCITLGHLTAAIEKLLRYVKIDDLKIKAWLESENYVEVLNEVDQILKENVSEKVYKLVKM